MCIILIYELNPFASQLKNCTLIIAKGSYCAAGDVWINAWCFRPRFCTVRLYWAEDHLGNRWRNNRKKIANSISLVITAIHNRFCNNQYSSLFFTTNYVADLLLFTNFFLYSYSLCIMCRKRMKRNIF